METEPGTLLWVGPTAHAEFVDAFRFCRDRVSQMAVRKNLSEAIRRPAGYVRRVIFARPTRQTPSRSLWNRFTARYATAPSVALCSSLCDGEARTGTPWAVDFTIRFSRWAELLPGWLSACGVRASAAEPGASLLVISDRFEMAEPYLQWASGLGLTTNWHRRFIPALHHGFDTVLWDDSSARPAAAAIWWQRLGDRPGDRPTAHACTQAKPTPAPQRHLWLALQPSVDAIRQATDGGIARVLTKPVKTESIFEIM